MSQGLEATMFSFEGTRLFPFFDVASAVMLSFAEGVLRVMIKRCTLQVDS